MTGSGDNNRFIIGEMREALPVTPEVLRWARESAGMSAQAAADALKLKSVTAQTIEEWEAGEGGPTYPQLEKLAKAYRRTIAVFFLPRQPSEPDIKKQFRSLTDAHLANLPTSIRLLVRHGTVRQMDLRELYDGNSPARKRIFADCVISDRTSPKQRAAQAREYLGVSLETQFSWPDDKGDTALKIWRHTLEECGVWVFKEAFKEDGYCGFCLPDEQFPVIFLNNSMPKRRQIFTLFHELAHLLRGRGGVDFRSPQMSGADNEYRSEEAFCNAFAGAFLVPDESLFGGRAMPSTDEENIEELAKRYGVSREVILRRFLDRGMVSQAIYDKRVAEWARQHRNTGNTSGGDYYATQFTYLGRKYIDAAFHKYHRQAISEYDLADYLGVKIRNLGGFEEYLLKEKR